MKKNPPIGNGFLTSVNPYGFILVILVLLLLLSGVSSRVQDKDGWRQLFNGKDLTGWRHAGPGNQYVEESVIKSQGGMGILYWQKEKFGNCKIKLVWRMRDENSNSGIFIRVPLEPREEWMPVHYGYEVQIDNKPELSDEMNTIIQEHYIPSPNRWQNRQSPDLNGIPPRSLLTVLIQ